MNLLFGYSTSVPLLSHECSTKVIRRNSPCVAVTLPIATFTFFSENAFAIFSSTLLSYVPGSCPWNVRSYLQKCRGKPPVSRRTNSREVRSRKLDEQNSTYISTTQYTGKGTMQLRYEDPCDSIAIRNQYGVPIMCQYADQICLIIDSCTEAKWSKQGSRVTEGRDSVSELLGQQDVFNENRYIVMHYIAKYS